MSLRTRLANAIRNWRQPKPALVSPRAVTSLFPSQHKATRVASIRQQQAHAEVWQIWCNYRQNNPDATWTDFSNGLIYEHQRLIREVAELEKSLAACRSDGRYKP